MVPIFSLFTNSSDEVSRYPT